MSKKKKNSDEIKIMDKALALYDSNVSMRLIQKKCGSKITVAKIKSWSVKRLREICGRPHCNKYTVDELDGVGYCAHCLMKQKRKTLNRAKRKNREKGKETKAGWKKRVFASWQDTPEQAAFRRSPEYQEWRVIVLERDKYTCQHCEQTGGRLVVHHVKTFKMNPELRLEPDNGIVLCNNCHEKLHLSRVKKPRILKLA